MGMNARLLLLVCGLGFSVMTPVWAQGELLARGEYILHVSGCVHCHTAEDGEPLAGGRGLETPFGVFYTPNITPHRSAGIGGWDETDLRRALRHGTAPDGSSYFPAFPYTSYTRMRTADVDALYAYLMSQPPSARENRSHELAWFLSWRVAATVWQWLFFDAGEFQLQAAHSASWNQGAYIASALAHCEECHTPRNVFGGLSKERAYVGVANGPDGEQIPNITSHPQDGIGQWSDGELDSFLNYGELPNGEYASGSMEPVLEGLNYLDAGERAALAEYLRALPALASESP